MNLKQKKSILSFIINFLSLIDLENNYPKYMYMDSEVNLSVIRALK